MGEAKATGRPSHHQRPTPTPPEADPHGTVVPEAPEPPKALETTSWSYRALKSAAAFLVLNNYGL